MSRIYFDNAATTAVSSEVLQEMLPWFSEKFGNPSSVHSYGRESKMGLEKARKTIAAHMHCKPGEIFFTSCGTESSNTAITSAIRDLGCKHLITSAIEHHATLHTAQFYENLGLCKVHWVRLLPDGHIDLNDLERILSRTEEKKLVTLMHANNEIGNMTDIEYVAKLCARYSAYFHTDAVQTVGHFPFNLQAFPIHFLSASAHKFHGPKSSGLLYINGSVQIKSFIHGGGQERNMRAGTENVAGIMGLAKALDIAMTDHESDKAYIRDLKNGLKEKLLSRPELLLNGCSDDQSLYTVLNIAFPKTDKTEVLSMNLDVHGICVSGGSACSSGAQGGSHVIRNAFPDRACVPIRFSFSKYNTMEEVELVAQRIFEML